MMLPRPARPLSPEERELKMIELLEGITFKLTVAVFALGMILGSVIVK